MRRLTWSIIRRKFYDFFYNLKTATCKIAIYHNTDYVNKGLSSLFKRKKVTIQRMP